MGEPLMVESLILQVFEKRDELSKNEIVKLLPEHKERIDNALLRLLESGAIEKRIVGSQEMYYALEKEKPMKVLIVEDDRDINRLIKLSLGRGFEILQAYDGNEGMKMVREHKPNLVILDLMLPGMNGLEICQAIKTDVALKDITVVIVSAADAAKNRFEGIRLGADYYIRKPFDPKELRSLVNIFLKKKGKRFDPLIDLPDEERISREMEELIGEGNFEICRVRIENIGMYAVEHGERAAEVIVRLVSQIIQEKAGRWKEACAFVGYVGNGEFIVGGCKGKIEAMVTDVIEEFERVLPFIYQEKMVVDFAEGIEGMFDAHEGAKNRLAISYEFVPPEKLLAKRGEILERRGIGKDAGIKDIGSYTYQELLEMLGGTDADVSITRDARGVRLSLSKPRNEGGEEGTR